MRFPIDPLPPVGVTEDHYEIQEKAAISALRPVATGNQPPLLMPQRRPIAEMRQVKATPPEAERRSHDDRRNVDRRVQDLPVLVDTRSGLDRRKNNRREADPMTRVDIKA